MPYIEPHIHCVVRTTEDYWNMSIAGILAVVEPSFWAGTDKKHVECFEDYWEHMTTFETARAKKYGIDHYVMISCNPKEARNPIAPKVVEAMIPFLDRECVLGVGEIGFDLITDEEEEIFRQQLRIAIERDLLVILHSPHQNKLKGIERSIEIIKEENAPEERIVLDHNTEETMELTLRETKCMAGMTIYYVTKLSAERAVNMMAQYGTDRMIINGSADWGYSDPLAVPKAAMVMRKSGYFSEAEVRKVTFDNPYNFLAQSPRFRLQRP
jgi:predicted metal-dependent TIM-barrel fold hydrolase